MLPWKLQKRQILLVKQNLSPKYFSLDKFQLVRCNHSLAMISQMTYTHKQPKVCSATLNPDFLNHQGKTDDQNIMFCLTKKARLFIMITRKLLRIIGRFEKSLITKIQFHYNCIAITNTDWQSRKKIDRMLGQLAVQFFCQILSWEYRNLMTTKLEMRTHHKGLRAYNWLFQFNQVLKIILWVCSGLYLFVV